MSDSVIEDMCVFLCVSPDKWWHCPQSHRTGKVSVCRLPLSFNRVTPGECACVCLCVCVCVCVCVCNHSDFLFPIRALIHQLAVAMVFLSPPNQSQASGHAQTGETHNFNCGLWLDGQKDKWSDENDNIPNRIFCIFSYVQWYTIIIKFCY